MSGNSVPCEETPLVASAITSPIAAGILTVVTTVLAVVSAVLTIVATVLTAISSILTIVTTVLTVVAAVLTIVAITADGKLDARLDVKKSAQRR